MLDFSSHGTSSFGTGFHSDAQSFSTFASLTEAEQARMADVKAEAKALCRATDYGVWAERPLPELLIEYATDCRFFPGLHARYEAELLRLCGEDAARRALVLAHVAESVERRVAAARSLEFSGDNRNNGRSDGRLTRAVSLSGSRSARSARWRR